MRPIAVLVGLAAGMSATASRADAQVGCDDESVTVSPAASVEGFSVLFQQNGVTFYGRAATSEGAPAARVLIRNGNRFPIEVSYNVLLEYAGDSLPRSLSLGRHCARIPAGQYATAEDAAPAPPRALRVRNLTIANLAAGQASTGRGAAGSAAAASSRGAVAVGPTGTPGRGAVMPETGRGPVTVNVAPARTPAAERTAAPGPAVASAPARQAAAPPGSSTPAEPPTRGDAPSAPPSGAGEAAPPRTTIDPAAITPAAAALQASDTPPGARSASAAAAQRATTAERPGVRRPTTSRGTPATAGRVSGVGAWALEATYAVFYLLSATVLVLAGVGLVLPVLGGVALLVIAGLSSLFRRGAPRSG